jgi:hypothetical protein
VSLRARLWNTVRLRLTGLFLHMLKMSRGSWTDHGAVFSSKSGDNYNAIDANVIQANGKLLFTFGKLCGAINESDATYRYWTGSYWADIFQFELAPSGLAPLSPSAPQITHLVLNQTAPQSAEGGFIYKPKTSCAYRIHLTVAGLTHCPSLLLPVLLFWVVLCFRPCGPSSGGRRVQSIRREEQEPVRAIR